MSTSPFRITSPGDPGIRRAPDNGRFVPAAPPQIVRRSSSEGIEVSTLIDENRAPEHPTPGRSRTAAGEMPPIPAKPPANKPFVLR